jgi:hypothetical protein
MPADDDDPAARAKKPTDEAVPLSDRLRRVIDPEVVIPI